MTNYAWLLCLRFVLLLLGCLLAAVNGGLSQIHPKQHIHEKLIVFLVDGVRYDYVTRDPTLKGFPRLARKGSKAEYVVPIFPSNSYPNWYSIVTGLYAENHGFVQNYMYDVVHDDTFLMVPHQNATHERWWNQSEPLWVTAEKSGKRTSMYWWDGCQVSIRGVKPTECREYENYWVWPSVKEDTEEALGDTLTWFQSSESHKLALLYYEGVDAFGHFRGPESEQVKQSVRDIDAIIDRFLDRLEEQEMTDKVNFVIVSDHGMTNSEPETTEVINLEDYNLTDDIELMLDRGSLTMILPVEGREERLFNNLLEANIKGVHVYRKDEIPDKYHFKNNHLVLPILLVADEGYFIQKISNFSRMKPSYSRVFKGYHGYDPEESSNMRTIFYAKGPSFREDYVSPPIMMVDHYNLFCHLLGIDPHPNNGSWDRVQGFFKNSAAPERQTNLLWTFIVLLLVYGTKRSIF